MPNIGKDEEETISSYESVLEAIKDAAFETWPEALIRLTRRSEEEKKARSDDATVVVVEVK